MFKIVTVLLAKLGQSQVLNMAVASAFFIALKAVLVFLIVSVLGIILHNFAIGFISDMISASADAYADNPDASALSNFVISFTGLGAYLAGTMKIPESISVLLAGFSIGAVRSFIPFIGK